MIFIVNRLAAIAEVRRAILECAQTLEAAVNCEQRFNPKYIRDTIITLTEFIKTQAKDLDGAWFSALVRVEGNDAIPIGTTQMLTDAECRKVSVYFD